MQGFWIHRPSVLDDRLSRGGPVLGRVSQDFWSVNISTDSRKRVVFNINADYGCNADHYCSTGRQCVGRDQATLERLPVAGAVGCAFGNRHPVVTASPDPTIAAGWGGNRYVFADLWQNSISMDTRVNVTFTTNLTFELFMQPLVASGRYTRFNEFAAPRSSQRLVYGVDIGTIQDTEWSITARAIPRFFT